MYLPDDFINSRYHLPAGKAMEALTCSPNSDPVFVRG